MLPEGAITAALLVPTPVPVDPLAGAGLDAARGADAPLSGLVVLPAPEGFDEADCEPPSLLPPPHAATVSAAASAGSITVHRAEGKRRNHAKQLNKKLKMFSVMTRSEH
ncbi:hypothetical protein [Caballeronia cordobensis]|uniref:hypothetical protein n=1 Tax=Caballeronia cordobensis TaxID=1353886 RepID=UPI0006AD6298|nr:hypothetical protein [Caballeronia cordobensis]